MKHSSPHFLTHPLLVSILLLACVFIFPYIYFTKQNDNQTTLISLISTNRLVLTNQIISTNQVISNIGVSSKQQHLISVFVGTTCTMQIRADSFSIKDGILLCQALNHDFYIVGSMHSIVIEEVKQGTTTVTALLNKPVSERKEQSEKPLFP